MNLNKLTGKAQEAAVEAQRLAASQQHTQVEPEHLLAALIGQQNGVVPAVLEKLEVSSAQVDQRLVGALGGFARAATPGQQVYVSQRFRRVFEAAQQEADRLKDDFVSTEHCLLAMAGEPVLHELGITCDRVLQSLQEVRGNQRLSSKNPETTYQSLEKYGRDGRRWRS
jgi:ATP-dependent Clp protease ATP-binding subunit ClpB